VLNALSPEQRSAIALAAVEMRWKKAGKLVASLPRATHTGEIAVGNAKIRCAVLEDGTRVLTQRDFLQAIGRSGKPAAGRGTGDLAPFEKGSPLFDSENLKPFVTIELSSSIQPIHFRVPTRSRAWGYKAEALPKVCEVYLKAREAGALRRNQDKFAVACEILVRAFAHVGVGLWLGSSSSDMAGIPFTRSMLNGRVWCPVWGVSA
jgi:hypothetical protein